MNELLSPNLLDLTEPFNKEFLGMTQVDMTLNDLLTTRNLLIKTIQQSLTSNEKEFLLSIKRGDPLWDLIPLEGLHKLPGLRWKLMNIKKMNKKAHHQALNKLTEVLNQ